MIATSQPIEGMARYLFVVSRDKLWLFDYLTKRFSGDSNVTVIVDRRINERRQGTLLRQAEFRRAERRARRAEEEDLATHGYFTVDL